MVWPDPYLVPSLRDPRIERTINGLSRKAWIHALSSAIHGLLLIRGLRTTYICSSLFRNLRNFEIALRILSIAKLRADFEIAYPPAQFGN